MLLSDSWNRDLVNADHRINRRGALGAFGAVGLGTLLAACGADDEPTTQATVTTTTEATATVAPQTSTSSDLASQFDDAATCTLTVEETEGPYYFDVDSIRTDIREDRKGKTLTLGFRVRDAAACEAIANAVVDVWHCDAEGSYSGFESASQGGPGGGRSDEKTYLRGAQVTNKDGIAEFKTVFPGWYRGRTTHIHFKVHIDKATVLTSQLFFDDDFTAKVYAEDPYASDAGRDTFNDGDNIFDESLIATAKEDSDGVLALMTVDVAKA
jgi:protocatechuate 3,4-dioxygenase beta subunit